MGVKEVLADSPACRSLRVGDIITTINDWQVQHIKQPCTVLYCTVLYCTVGAAHQAAGRGRQPPQGRRQHSHPGCGEVRGGGRHSQFFILILEILSARIGGPWILFDFLKMIHYLLIYILSLSMCYVNSKLLTPCGKGQEL